ncbi:MAG: hypothetical protein GY696_19080, partial [Gammaproteobacteria bacterium]|nr:hypothetical protein [Gammaproteobacteria bacterium]
MTHQKQQLPSKLYLVPSKLGLLLGGSTDDYKDFPRVLDDYPVCYNTAVKLSVTAMSLFFSPDPPFSIVPNLKDMWSLEAIGIMDNPDINDDDRALKTFNDRIQYINGRYHLSWPWTEENPDLPDNRSLTMLRFKNLLRKYKANPQLLAACDQVFQDQLGKNIIEAVDDEDINVGLVHYLPHHAVVTPGKSTKTRVVFDASAKKNRNVKSFNDCLYRGPILLPDLVGLLIRFWLPRIGVVSDIAKA